MRSIAIAMAVLLIQVISLPAGAEAPAGSHLTNLLEAELSRWPVRSGLYVKHLDTGEQVSIRAHERFESASTIKVAIMVRAFQLVDQQQLDLRSRHELKAEDYRGGSGIFKYKDPGLRPTLHDIITQMIITSDNTATDFMVAKVGGRQKLNEFLRQAGYQALQLNHTTNEFFRLSFEALDPKYASLTPLQVFALETDRPDFRASHRQLIEEVAAAAARNRQTATTRANDDSHWFGVAAPAEMGRLLEGIERCTVASQQSCDDMKRILRAQQVRHKIPHYLSVPSGSKTGETGSVSNDVAIVYAKSGPIVITSYNMEVQEPRTETDDRIGVLARRVVDYFDGVNE